MFFATAIPVKSAETEVEQLKNTVSQLMERIERLEQLLLSKNTDLVEKVEAQAVVLEQDDYVSINSSEAGSTQDVISSNWFENFQISGFGSFSYIATGDAGTRPEGGFLIKEASLFVEADTWKNTALFFEIQTNRLGDDKTKWLRTGEVYVHLRDVFPEWEGSKMGVKVGRMDLPFGEEYLMQDANDNPLISFSAAYPYGWDEGVLIYGDYQGLGWAASVMDGTDERSVEDDSSKTYNAKLWANPIEPLYLSASVMVSGKTAKSALEFGGSHFRPVGNSRVSTAGSSASQLVEAFLWEVDAKYSFGENLDSGSLWLSYGEASLDDQDSTFDRDLRWLVIEPIWYLTESVYLAGRYSEIGTFDSQRGYHFDGKTTAGGNSAFGYDVKSFQRISIGLGWWINQRTSLKIEYSKDDFKLIEASPFSPENDERDMFGIEITTALQ